jgi:hypothetical protein
MTWIEVCWKSDDVARNVNGLFCGIWKTGLKVGVDSSDGNGVESERNGNGVAPDEGC